MAHETLQGSRFRYLDASLVRMAGRDGGRFAVHTAGDERVGYLAGMVVDPSARRVRYFVVDLGGWLRRRRYLLPLCPAQVEPDGETLKLHMNRDEVADCGEFDPAEFPTFSDEDVLDALFAQPAAA